MFTIDRLKDIAFAGECEFDQLRNLDEKARSEILHTLGNFPNPDEEMWILNIVKLVSPEIHNFINYYTAGGYQAIRNHQEGNDISEKLEETINGFMSQFNLLPKWNSECYHYSNSKDLLEYFRLNRVFELKSFMSCAKPGTDFSYASNPATVINFTSANQGAFLGAMTREHCEREIIFPAGAKFILNEIHGNTVILDEV